MPIPPLASTNERARSSGADSLSPTQREVLRLRALGWTVLRVCQHLRIGGNTYYHHLAEAKERLGVVSEPEAWTAMGWLRVPAR